MTRILSERPASADEWDRIWQACSYATYFQSREWAEIWRDASCGRIEPRPLLVRFDDGREALIANCKERIRKGLLRGHLLSPAGTYGGWLSSDVLTADHAALLFARILRWGNVQWRLSPYDPLALEAAVGSAAPDDTHVLDLEPGFEAIRHRWSKGDIPWAFRKATRMGVTARPAETIEDWRAYYEIYEDTLQRWGDTATSRYEWPLFEQMATRGSSRIQLLLAQFEGSAIAGILLFTGPRHRAYWHGAALKRCFHLHPYRFLLYEAIRQSCEQGLRWFDFNPSNNLAGVRAFKEGFGARSLPSPVLNTFSLASRTLAVLAQLTKGMKPH